VCSIIFTIRIERSIGEVFDALARTLCRTRIIYSPTSVELGQNDKSLLGLGMTTHAMRKHGECAHVSTSFLPQLNGSSVGAQDCLSASWRKEFAPPAISSPFQPGLGRSPLTSVARVDALTTGGCRAEPGWNAEEKARREFLRQLGRHNPSI